MLATPCYGGLVHHAYMGSVIRLLQAAPGMGLRVSVELLGNDSLVQRARNTLVAKFLAMDDASHLLFIDGDIAFETGQIARMLGFGEDVVAGMYPLKMIHWDEAALERAVSGEGADLAPLSYVGCPEAGGGEWRDGFVTGTYAGAGCMLISRAALLRMTQAFPETRYAAAHTSPEPDSRPHQYALFDCMIDRTTGHYLSEDYAFCQRWRSIGGRVWLDTQGQLTHTGMHEFHGEPDRRFPPPHR